MFCIFQHLSKVSRLLTVLSAVLALSGCCYKNKTDPFEGINRGVYLMNRTADRLFLKPAALAATKFVPKIFLGAIDNFFSNLADLPTIANEVLQLKFSEARSDAARFIINSTLGVGGLFDFATKAGREKHSADFGQTLAFYGYKESAYIVLPFFGPSTIRDAAGRGVDLCLTVWPYLPESLGWKLYGVYLVDLRARHLKKEEVLKEAAVDEYILVRDAYLQNRRYVFGDKMADTEELEGEWTPIDGLKKEDDKKENTDASQDQDKKEADKDGKDANADKNEDGTTGKTDEKDPNKKIDETQKDNEKDSKDSHKTETDLDKKMKLDLPAKPEDPLQKPKTKSDTVIDNSDIKGPSTVPIKKGSLVSDESENNRQDPNHRR